MFAASEVISALKNFTSNERPAGRTYCQALDVHAQQLGYQSYHHLTRSLNQLPSDKLGKYSMRLMRRICARRLPSQDCSYCSFTAHRDGSISYYSHWIGWDQEGCEVRVPSPLDGKRVTEKFRQSLDHPIYVLETPKELLAWHWSWFAGAVIPEPLAKDMLGSLFKQEHLVAKDPPMDKVRIQSALCQQRLDEAARKRRSR
ncbi:MAG TPA: hypothetical protein VGD45_05710 [Steroidobacter sp.]|uniref:hypothetical protein n=1 Tax=Steroidobacter sp. TaxID=1978227 RepID=UPI002ED77EA7